MSARDVTARLSLRAVDSTVYCHAEMRAGEVVLTVCPLPLGHEPPHVDGCTRWSHDDRPRKPQTKGDIP